MKRPFFFVSLLLTIVIGCSGDPRLSVKNTYSTTVFYEVTIAGDVSAYLSGQMTGKETKILALQTGKNLLIFNECPWIALWGKIIYPAGQ